MSNSPYPELKALSDKERLEQLETKESNLRWLISNAIVSYRCDDIDTAYKSLIHAQIFLDRIKELVLTRGTNEK